MGYDNSNLSALPYDWRIPPFELQRFALLFLSANASLQVIYLMVDYSSGVISILLVLKMKLNNYMLELANQ